MTPGEKALAVAKFPAQATVDAAGDLGTLPIRAREAADVYAATGQYDPAPFVETAMNTMGGTAFSAPAGAMGAGPVMRKSLLDMGQEARMGRAQAQGFDTAQPLYHGTSKDFDFKSFKDSRHGTWTTTDPKEASGYAMQNDSKSFRLSQDPKARPWDMEAVNSSDRVLPLYGKPLQNPAYVESYPDRLKNATNYKKAQSEWFDELKAKGHDGVMLPGGVRVDFDNANLRGQFAAFDPKNEGKGVILGAGAGDRRGAIALAGPQAAKQGDLDYLRYNYFGANPKKGLKDGPINPFVQTVDDPYRMMYPGIYRHPGEIAETAAARVAPEDEALQRLWGVSRRDLEDIGAGRVGNEVPDITNLAAKPKGAASAANVMNPRNEQRLIDTLAEGGKHEGLAHADAWYVMDPMFWRLREMFGQEEAVKRYQHLNAMTGMASPGSDVLTEIQRGTGAHWLQSQGRFDDFLKYAGLPETLPKNAKPGAVSRETLGDAFPADMRYIGGHPYHMTSQGKPMSGYLERGSIASDAPKVPSYVLASGTPETGFQTKYAVGDAHYSRGVGLADTRKGPTDVQASWSPTEYQTMSPWWREKIAEPLGIEAVPAQARLWTILGPQTGVDSPLGQGKLELFSKQIMKASKRMGVSPETARDLILSGKAGAGVLAGAVIGADAIGGGYRAE